MNRYTYAVCVVLVAAIAAYPLSRIKDVSRIEGIEETQLVGYGLIVGLDGSGDGSRTMFTVHSIINMLRNLGIYVPTTKIRIKNVAAVMVTATLPPFTKRGAKIDVSVSSIGDAISLEGGTLLLTPLQDENGENYALAQGAVSIGGYSIGRVKSAMRKKNHPLSGEIPAGAVVKREVLSNELNTQSIRVSLTSPDFTSAVEMTKTINAGLNANFAKTIDAATVEVSVPQEYVDKLMTFIAMVEQMQFEPNRVARVVLNEKTGTIVAGAEVTIAEVAVSHGSITVSVSAQPQVSQPLPLSTGKTIVTEQVQTSVVEEKPQMVVLKANTNVGDLAKALNEMGVTPRDMIAIFQAIKKAGAINAEVVCM
ncbi:MAG: hypothetical protein A2268_00075 [Candidatus Raymondbacteria bacterium RifOxyA12_full_50_37]|uniref:Flagellar P-ring protein n=1 Tax=Candidatus Raymondbacteria bacterium RIFOXYD12_FULL_49_13 TaxID=1817890 RepID=A0A1F7F3K0_UNCRA|nr:MAG: hypothetical protein A2248_00325 [Candidatus Raymondbacteria bacterium RIFOXYA2_FULL_49_16]OGJ91103.1 MAG: hypothetical protein A2350_07345 [Candidatus Raymondbacteria bacterium RifOxyB12_full_50_8]OGJ91372.1 MAG: hypothetical protein A2268_00075 [Candidatus Raymondbacteria bacterium RifOxyA12_full_50_37]OGJ97157.1 MAG: hypothetical protein A2453_12595 [Candidatus Raymondbacteria bacterium RIFOXYC2_FULL_50_21]OGK01142.1 MAG: hypothetical protein A2519_01295 [Candidatus Raymondbacteria b